MIPLTSNEVYTTSEVKLHALGQKGADTWGNIYRYAKLGADATAGKLLIAQAEADNHQNISVASAASAGDDYIEVTLGATAVTTDEYVDGFLSFVDTSPEGEGYRIVAHETSSAGSEAIKIWLNRPLLTAATTSSEVALTRSLWSEPAVGTDVSLEPAGVTMVDIDASEKPYCWLKTRGEVAVLGDSTGIGVGVFGTTSDEDAGAVGLYSDVDAERKFCRALDASVDGEYFPVYLFID